FCVTGATQSCVVSGGIGPDCTTGTQTCSGGSWGTCVRNVAPVAENTVAKCNDQKDNDCDDKINFLDPDCTPFCVNADGDPFKISGGLCGAIDCRDANNTIFPNAPEKCDGVDNQCPQSQTSIDENPNEICPLVGSPGIRKNICISGTCKTPTAYWTSDSNGINKITTEVIANASQKFYLVLENYPIGISKWEFEIYEDDTLGGDDEIRTGGNKLTGIVSGNKIIAEWTINSNDIGNAQNDDADLIYEFYFKAKGFDKLGGTWEYGAGTGTWERTEYNVAGTGTWKEDGGTSTGTWEVTGIWGINKNWKIDGGTFGGTFTFDNEAGTWISDGGAVGGTWITTTKEDESVYEFQSLILGAEEVQPPQQGICGDGALNQGETCDDGDTNAEDGCSATCVIESGFTCSGEPSICTETPIEIDCSQYNLCSDYNATLCTDDPCSVSILDGCSWSASTNPPSCNPYKIIINSTGGQQTCNYQENITATCDGTSDFFEYSLNSLTVGCADEDPVSILCSSKTKLPLENKYGIILTIISIIGIYSFWFFRRKNKIESAKF
ncbi:MAG: hypothetical protein Q8O84_03190, partial [Nanoarchaeota archaeon]|nr:hypothetical protein [Nanoarchaeota archaeon]